MDNVSDTLSTITDVVKTLRHNFQRGITKPIAYRQQQLAGLKRFLKECATAIEQALYEDLKKSSMEARTTEIDMVAMELRIARRKLASWTKPKRVNTPLMAQPGKSYIYPEPYGLALIIAPWNYPIQLLLSPLIGAIAAGNCVIVKPSEVAAATSQLLVEKLPLYLDPQSIQVIDGGVAETTALLAEQFDYIFYTGNSTVGRIVMQAAAKNLTPVCLELGGKSPCIVDKDTNLRAAAQRIAWGKFLNAGQMCVAPDYILIEKSVEHDFVQHLKKSILSIWGKDPKTSPYYGRIINVRHHQRLANLLPGSGDIAVGGEMDEENRYMAPTILREVPTDAPVMCEEIFGPILPIITVENINEAIAYVNARSKPLALYLFTNQATIKQQVIEQTSSGSICINHVVLQLTVPSLPFGGVGASGIGAYHGKASFETFSHHKSVFKKPIYLDPLMPYLALQKALAYLRKLFKGA